MTRYLTIYVRAYEGRYHGDGDDFPSPFRLFQALVAGAGTSGPLDEESKQALTWLEGSHDAPIIASPRTVRGQSVSVFMPNNDLDAKGGDVRRIGEIRLATKVWNPRIFDAAVPWIYAWPFANEDERYAVTICVLSEKLYQLGRGIDMAWAWGELLDEQTFETRLAEYDGIVRRPSVGDGLRLACPCTDSLKSLERRHQARRFRYQGAQRVFVRPPRPRYRQLAYESPLVRYVFELRSALDSGRQAAWPLVEASSLVVAAREAARKRLIDKIPSRAHEIDRHLVGRRADGSNAVPAESRVRIVAIPSIGMHYADRAIRRLLIEVPPACPLRNDDVRWAFSGAELFDPDTGEVKDVLLAPTTEEGMLRHYGVDISARVFRSVTPVVLPEAAKRRRIEPTRKLAEAKPGLERAREIAGARAALVQALRHAGISTPVDSIRLQREPFEAAGSRVEPFAEGTRFEKERLWHIEISFAAPIKGPLLIGDGRFLGLGLMAQATDIVPGVHAFAITEGLVGKPDPIDVARALRRAVMARVQSVIGVREPLDPFFSGHAEDGTPVRRVCSSHLSFAFEGHTQRLLILSPHIVECRAPAPQELKHLRTLDLALEGFRQLRTGGAGILTLAPSANPDVLFAHSRVWRTSTPYVVTRHAKGGTAKEALIADVLAECRRVGLPEPRVEPNTLGGVPKMGLTGDLRLTFGRAVPGPILLGRTRYFGGGLFRAVR